MGLDMAIRAAAFALISLLLLPASSEAVGGGRMVYSVAGDLYSTRADGTGRDRLAPGPIFAVEWSPDRSLVAFVREDCEEDDCHTFLYLVRNDGSELRQLAPFDSGRTEIDWAPDSGRVAFAGPGDDAFDTELYVASVEGDVRRLTDTSGVQEFEPDFSPDGTTIVFTEYSEGDGIRYDIGAVDVDGSGRRSLTQEDSYESGPRWSPDGTRIVYSTTRDDDNLGGIGTEGPYSSQIYVMDPDGSNPTRVSTSKWGFKRDIQWSLDSKRLAWWVDCRDTCSRHDVWVARADGSRQRNVTRNGEDLFESDVHWSPNGRRLVFLGWRGNSSRSDIYSIRVDGTGLRRLTPTREPEAHLDWQTW